MFGVLKPSFLQNKTNFIYFSSFLVSICGIIYQVLYGAVGSYLLGSSILAYSISIGGSLSGMGLGAAHSEKLKGNLIDRFINTEYRIGMVGGFSTLFLYIMFATIGSTTAVAAFVTIVFLTGYLTGLELPILIREAERRGDKLEKSTAMTLLSDYAGSLIGTLGFALLLNPLLGSIKTAFLVAIINTAIALWVSRTFRNEVKKPRLNQATGVALTTILVLGFTFGDVYSNGFEQKMYQSPIVYDEQTKYQRLTITKEKGDLRLYINGNLQLAESDEYRYHEALIHPAMSLVLEKTQRPLDVLFLGGGDGLAAREVAKYKTVKSMTLVDLDPEMTRIARENNHLKRLNQGSLEDERLTIIHQDAFGFLKSERKLYDLIVVDLPDPNSIELNKLYTVEFYSMIKSHLKPNGATVIQSTSPVFATESFWTISETVKSTGMETDNFHLDVPSFGNWGFTIASNNPFEPDDLYVPNVKTRFLTTNLLPGMFEFGKDEDKEVKGFEYEVNTINNSILHILYNKAWKYY